jgi:hypothetical protein
MAVKVKMLRLFVLVNHSPNTIPRVLMRPRKGSNMGGKTWLRGEIATLGKN